MPDFSQEVEQVRQILAEYPQFRVITGRKFAFRPPKTIILGQPQSKYALQSLHELAHGLCGHKTFSTYIERVKMESEAWERAKTLCLKYDIEFDEEFAEEQLDTYRDWLHQKSVCRQCGQVRYQSPDGNYHCPQCETFCK